MSCINAITLALMFILLSVKLPRSIYIMDYCHSLKEDHLKTNMNINKLFID